MWWKIIEGKAYGRGGSVRPRWRSLQSSESSRARFLKVFVLPRFRLKTDRRSFFLLLAFPRGSVEERNALLNSSLVSLSCLSLSFSNGYRGLSEATKDAFISNRMLRGSANIWVVWKVTLTLLCKTYKHKVQLLASSKACERLKVSRAQF